MLNEIRKAADMGVVGIDAVQHMASQLPMHEALMQQRQEYIEIMNRADSLLQAKGGRIRSTNPIAKRLAAAGSAMKLSMEQTDSKLAEMMIEGNTKGMIRSYQNIRSLDVKDSKTVELSRKLLDTELHNIEQMKKFL